jgi:hypothetical protein
MDPDLNRSCLALDVLIDARAWQRSSDHVPVIATLG